MLEATTGFGAMRKKSNNIFPYTSLANLLAAYF